MNDWQTYLEQRREQALADFLDFLRIPSISAEATHIPDVAAAAAWTAARMERAGIEHVRVMPTGGHPVVSGDWLHAAGKPTLLIYGHFDTQPADPLALWTSPPFEPAVRDGRVYARGAGDDKGNMLIPILVAEAFLATRGSLPVNLKFIFEGQEEIGSPQLPEFLAQHKALFACDLAISADGGQEGENQPALLVGLKGVIALQIDVQGATTDLHSGLYGGTIQNPLHALVRLLDSMRSPDGLITVEGFYDDVVPLSAEDRARIAEVPFDEAAYLKGLDVDAPFGEPGYTTRERGWARPTLELNGMWGGFQGEGVKTVLPNEAHAKISCRLVANQDPARIQAALAAHIAKHVPVGVRVTVRQDKASALPYLMPADHPANQIAAEVLTDLYGVPPHYIRMGGSVPVVPLFLAELGVYTLTFAFALDDERHHAPDESFRLASFERGKIGYGMLWERFGR